MKILAFDSSTDLLTVALAQGDINTADFNIIASISTNPNRQHGELLAPTVSQLLTQVDWTESSIDAVVVGIGPGSYTGLRIGVTFAKIWAHARKVPLYTVSSLSLMAATVSSNMATERKQVLLPLMDARRGTVYTGLYHWQSEQLQNILEDRHDNFSSWLTTIEKTLRTAQEVVLIGTDIDPFIEVFKEKFPEVKLQVISSWEAYPQAYRAFNQLEWTQVDDIATLAPNYAHETLAEQEWKANASRQGEEVDVDLDSNHYIDHLK